MSADPSPAADRLVPFADVGRAMAWLDRPPHAVTIYRWYRTGRNGVRLRAVKGVGGMCTCEAWLREFLATADPAPSQPATIQPAPAGWRHQQAERVLDQLWGSRR